MNKLNTNTAEGIITHKIIGCAMEVHKILGNGFQEAVYQRSLHFEMLEHDISVKREVEVPIFYKGNHVGSRRVDFLVEDFILVELKAIINLESVHLAQAKNYLEAFNLQTGLLINFGAVRLQFKRIFNASKKIQIF